jgi:hypothetical protein
MSIVRRVSIVMVLVAAVASGPLLADYCTAACEHAGRLAAGETAPPCHRQPLATTRVGGTPSPCGHQHQAPLIATLCAATSTSAPVDSLAVLPSPIVVSAAVSRETPTFEPERSPDSSSHAAPSPLRI